MSKVLLIEDEPAIADTLVYALGTECFTVTHTLTGTEGLAAHAWVEQDGRALRPAAPGAHVRLGVLQRSETA